MTSDIVIAGGGIIGLSVALELARHGLRVRVVERGRPMAEASWAAAGMLAVEDPENPDELTPLARYSRSLYPQYLSLIERLSSRSIPVRTRNALQATRPGAKFHCAHTETRSPLAPEQARQRIEMLQTDGRSFLWLEELSLDPRDVCAALPAAAIQAGVELQEHTAVHSVAAKSGSVEVATSAGAIAAGAFINCCGAWAGSLEPLHPARPRGAAGEAAPPLAGPIGEAEVEPRKGQMLVVRLQNPSQLRYVLRTPEVYLVPRGDGRVVVGATVERAGFDHEVQSGALHRLLALAADIWPPIESAPIVESWAGLRPGTEDGLPILGRAAEPNCWIATGHFRNGILLAPATAAVMRDLVVGRTPEISLEAFAVRRAHPAAVAAAEELSPALSSDSAPLPPLHTERKNAL